MLDLTYQNLLSEVEAARTSREKYLTSIRNIRRLYVGNHFADGEGPGKAIPENYLTSWVASIIGQVAFNNPSVRCRSRVGRSRAELARYTAAAVNSWICRTDHGEQSLLNAIDMMFGYSIALVAMADAPRGGRIRYWEPGAVRQLPSAPRLAPESYFWDQAATAREGVRFEGHEYQLDVEDALKVPFFNAQVLRDCGFDDRRLPDTGFAQANKGPSRKRVTLYDVYIPELRAVATLAPSARDYVRQPTAYEGPTKGPYVFGGVYPVPGSASFLSPVQAALEQFEALARQERVAAQEASNSKEIVVCGGDAKVASTIKDAATGSVVNIPGFNPQLAMQVRFGGVAAGRMQYIEELKRRADNQSGMSNVRRGTIEGGSPTATEIATLQNNSDVRVGYISNRFIKFETDRLGRVGWCFYHTPTASITIEDPDRPGTALDYIGGLQPGQEQDQFDEDYELSIEPFSMRRTDPIAEGQQAQNNLAMIANVIAPAMQQFPWLKWRDILDDLGESMNVPDFADRVLPAAGPGMMPGMPGMMPMGMGPGQVPVMPGAGAVPGAVPAPAPAPVQGRGQVRGMALAQERAGRMRGRR